MSIVCCRVYDDRIDFASDSIIVRGWTQEKSKDNFSKMFRINGMIIGGVGTAKESGLLSLFCRNHKPLTASEDHILEFIAEFAEWKNNKIDEGDIENSYLIGINGRAFFIEQYFVKEIVTYEAIGAGMEYALAALYLEHTPADAVKVACELSILCEEPICVESMERRNHND